MTTTTQLEWHEHTLISGPLMHTAYTQRGRYDVTQAPPDRWGNNRWHTTRMDHPLVPSFDGYCDTFDAAKRACEHDFIGLARADRWLDYMRDNEPPA